jgi:trehalose 6-phosphate synthase/phosphatase
MSELNSNDKRKWIIASNRLPFALNKNKTKLTRSSGGLVTALSGIHSDNKLLWTGVAPEGVSKSSWTKLRKEKDKDKSFHPIFLDETDYDLYYNGMCNNALWPILHYESEKFSFSKRKWDAYCDVNQTFARQISKLANDDDLVWVHDFHLFMLPSYLKKLRPKLRVGFFLHTPFPSSEIFSQFPARKEILRSLLTANLVGFHDYSYLRHFVTTVSALLGLECSAFSVQLKDHICNLGVFPVSIDTPSFIKQSNSSKVKSIVTSLKKDSRQHALVLGVDRLDYIKGIELKLKAFRRLLSAYPIMRGKVCLLQIAVPSRTDVPDYQQLKTEVERLVGDINGSFGTPYFVPVQYIHNSVGFDELLALYRHADALLVTSKRDGMNLVALEYLAAQPPVDPGVVVLSEFTGAMSALSQVLPTNPWDLDQTADQLHRALTMNLAERKKRHHEMIGYLKNYTATVWAASFMKALDSAVLMNENSLLLSINGKENSALKKILKNIKGKPLQIILDYDGTLTPIRSKPEQAILDHNSANIIKSILEKSNVNLVVASGRDSLFLKKQLTPIGVSYAAEHGASFFESETGTIHKVSSFKRQNTFSKAKNIIKDYCARVPGSFLEKKVHGLAWHYRNSPTEFAEFQARRLKMDLEAALRNTSMGVMAGKKVIEIRSADANKGAFAKWYIDLLTKQQNIKKSVFMGIGDDTTDEDLFLAIKNVGGISIKVGEGPTIAQYRLRSQKEVLPFLEKLAKNSDSI